MGKETMVQVKKEVLDEFNIKEENIEDMSEREKMLQKTVSKLFKKNRKVKDKLNTERIKVKALEQEV